MLKHLRNPALLDVLCALLFVTFQFLSVQVAAHVDSTFLGQATEAQWTATFSILVLTCLVYRVGQLASLGVLLTGLAASGVNGDLGWQLIAALSLGIPCIAVIRRYVSGAIGFCWGFWAANVVPGFLLPLLPGNWSPESLLPLFYSSTLQCLAMALAILIASKLSSVSTRGVKSRG